MALNLNWKQAAQALRGETPRRTGYGIQSEMAVPPGWSTIQYLAAYGQVGWLFGAISLISASVAEVEWSLYKGDKELDEHPLLDLLMRPNPFQTRYELIMMAQTYQSLVGKNFIVLNYNGRYPSEMWLAPPQYMSILPDKQKYIRGYMFREGGAEIFFNPQEVIYTNSPNPLNPMDGMGAVQSISTDLQNEIYATKYTNKLFYNDAVPGFAVEIPEMYTAEQRKEYQEDWDKRHKGWSNARKTAFLWGGAKINTITMSNKDMDFATLRSKSKEVILGALHVPLSLMGVAEVGSRARAEADEYIFAKRVVKPALQLFKEAFNEQLCPLFGPDLELTFDDPVPANAEMNDNSTRLSYQSGLITREEARAALGYDPTPTDGETLMVPFASTPYVVGEEPEEEPAAEEPVTETFKGVRYSEEQLEIKWNSFAVKTEALEKPFMRAIKSYFNEQQKVVIANLERNPSLEGATFADGPADKAFVTKFKPIIMEAVLQGWNDALSEFSKSAHKQSFDVLNYQALEWITNRSLSLAQMVNGTTKAELRKVLAAGFARGDSIPDIIKSINVFYKDGYELRAPLVARTEVITASNRGANELYKSEGVQKVQWYTAMDERLCPECEALHEKVFPIDDGPRPALHPQCRCVITAYLD